MTNDFRTQIYLAVGAGLGGDDLTAMCAALETAPIGCVLIRPVIGVSAPSVFPFVEAAQSRGVAALIANDAGLARTLRADGVHLDGSDDDFGERYDEARSVVGAGQIVGADAMRSRDLAMRAGEAGADYIAFGCGDAADDRLARLDLVEWWAEVFEVPVVALGVEEPIDALDLARAGADFVGVGLRAGWGPANAREHVASMARAVAEGASTKDERV